MTANSENKLFKVYRGKEKEAIGTIQYGDQGKLSLIDSLGAEKVFLKKIVDQINNKTCLYEEASPPDGAPSFSSYSRTIERADPNFFKALCDYLNEYYELHLEI